jgi:hypothetical protein
VHVKHGKITYSGSAVVYTPAGQHTVKMKFSATVHTKTVSGTVELPSPPCSKITFTAHRTGHTA